MKQKTSSVYHAYNQNFTKEELSKQKLNQPVLIIV